LYYTVKKMKRLNIIYVLYSNIHLEVDLALL
jgi:hypothetical protein